MLSPMLDEATENALVEEALKRSGVVWLRLAGSERTHARWHLWRGQAAYVLTGPGEQPDPWLGEVEAVDLIVASKDDRSRLLEVRAAVTRLRPTDADWDEVSAELARSRLNLSDAQGAPSRWADDNRVAIYRLVPTGRLVEAPGTHREQSHRAPPPPTPATTRGRTPWVLHRRRTKRRPLS